ncbi:MAG: CehA/McbA family metallohydrolase [Acidobacteriaceae bacterium]
MPQGVQRVTLTFSYTEREKHTALDLGLLDPAQLRCWSGGNKSTLTVGISDATPSCLPGLIPAGRWNILIGVPNIRASVTSHYTAHVYFARSGLVADEPAVLRAPLRTGAAWYRGDLHMHTAHSDGQCQSQLGRKVPCPLFFTVDAAARRGLDFIAISDHNATSHYGAMRELQPYFDKVLLIPAREITTFQGHLNLIGTTSFLDFRLGSKQVPDINTLLHAANKSGAVISINHPDAPTGEMCMGCGWTPNPPADMSLLQCVEAVNGGSEVNGYSDIPFWDKQLDKGYRLTGIGGSDNHNALKPLDEISSIGSPTTVVYATELSTPAILAGIRAGHVFVDLTGSRNRLLEATAHAGGQMAAMGDALHVRGGETVQFDMHVVGVEGGKVELLEDGKALHPQTGSSTLSSDQTVHFTWTADNQRHWFRAEVLGPDGKLWELGNPIYVNWPAAAAVIETTRSR